MEQLVLFALPLKMTKASKQTHGSLLPMAMATAAAEGLFGISRDNPASARKQEQVQVGGGRSSCSLPLCIHHWDR